MNLDYLEKHELLLKTIASETLFYISALNSDTWPNPNIFQQREYQMLIDHGLARRDVCGLTEEGFKVRDELRDIVLYEEMRRKHPFPVLAQRVIRERSVPRL